MTGICAALLANFYSNAFTALAYSGSFSSTSVSIVLYFLLSKALFLLYFELDAKPPNLVPLYDIY